MIRVFFFAVLSYSALNEELLGPGLDQKDLDLIPGLRRQFLGFLPPESNSLEAEMDPAPQAPRYVQKPPQFSPSDLPRTLVRSTDDPSSKSLKREIKIGDKIYDLSIEKAPGYEGVTIHQHPKTTIYVGKGPTPGMQTFGAGVSTEEFSASMRRGKDFDRSRDFSGVFSKLFPLKSFIFGAQQTIPDPKASQYGQTTSQFSKYRPSRKIPVKSTKAPSSETLKRKFKKIDRTYDYSMEKRPEYEELTMYPKPLTTFHVERVPSSRVPNFGHGVTTDFPMTVGGLALSHLSYPFGVDLNHPSFDSSHPRYPDQPLAFDPDFQFSSSSKPDILTKPDVYRFQYLSDSKYCAYFPQDQQKACMAKMTCEKRTSCSDCTYDFKCFWCSSKKSCMPSKTFGFDSFTGEHCPASDIYYFQTCRVKSFIVTFILVVLSFGVIFLTLIGCLACVWRKSRRGRIYNTIKATEKEFAEEDHNALID